jgi:hypothetical protein
MMSSQIFFYLPVHESGSDIVFSGFGGIMVSVLASGTQDREFKPGRSRQIFQGEKILSMPSFGGEVKLSDSCLRFVACKRTLHLMTKFVGHFSPIIPSVMSLGVKRLWR